MREYKYTLMRFVTLVGCLAVANGSKINWPISIAMCVASISWGLISRYEAKEEDKNAC